MTQHHKSRTNQTPEWSVFGMAFVRNGSSFHNKPVSFRTNRNMTKLLLDAPKLEARDSRLETHLSLRRQQLLRTHPGGRCTQCSCGLANNCPFRAPFSAMGQGNSTHPIHSAGRTGDVSVVRRYLKNPAILNRRDLDDMTCLHW